MVRFLPLDPLAGDTAQARAIISAGPLSVLEAVLVLCAIVGFHGAFQPLLPIPLGLALSPTICPRLPPAEAGHFFAARLQGIHVKEFSIGMGPSLINFKAGICGVAAVFGMFPCAACPGGPEPLLGLCPKRHARLGGAAAPSRAGAVHHGNPFLPSIFSSEAGAPDRFVSGPSEQDKGGVEYSLRALPLGGYVAFPDEDPESEFDPADPDLLKNRSIKDRAVVISAGVVANCILAFAVLLAQASIQGAGRGS